MELHRKFLVPPGAIFLAAVVLMGCAGTAAESPADESTESPAQETTQEVPPADTPTEEATESPPAASNALVVEDQVLGAVMQVIVQSVTADQPAWVVVVVDFNGTPGPPLDDAWVRVEAGTTENVVVPLLRPPPPVRPGEHPLWVTLNADLGVEGTYEFPGADVFLLDASGAPVTVPFILTVQ